MENRKVYCSLSERADEKLLQNFMEKFNSISKTPYRCVTWHSCDKSGSPIYHTNVIMALLHDHAVLCTASIPDLEERARVVAELTSPELNIRAKTLIDISYQEMLDMAGNMLMVHGKHGHALILS